jgi:hypothetical protein
MKVRLKKKDVKRLISGYRKASEFIAKEREKRLSSLTPDTALKEYDNLCKTYSTIRRDDINRVDRTRISFLIKRRIIFNKLGETNR